MEVVLRAHMWKVGSTWSKSFKCYNFEEFWRNWIVQTQDWYFIYHCSLRRDWCLWTEDSLLKLKIAPEEQCKFYALLAIHLYMWDQVLTLAVLLFGMKGLALPLPAAFNSKGPTKSKPHWANALKGFWKRQLGSADICCLSGIAKYLWQVRHFDLTVFTALHLDHHLWMGTRR